jgi:hypothetical protein
VKAGEKGGDKITVGLMRSYMILVGAVSRFRGPLISIAWILYHTIEDSFKLGAKTNKFCMKHPKDSEKSFYGPGAKRKRQKTISLMTRLRSVHRQHYWGP